MCAFLERPTAAANEVDESGAITSIEQWSKEWMRARDGINPTERGFALLSRCAIVSKKDNAFKFIEVDPIKAVKQSLMETPDKTTVMLALEVNSLIDNDDNQTENEKENPCEKSLSSIAKCYNVDGVLDVTGPNWKFYRYVPKFKKMKVMFERPAGESGDYFRWIQEQLNFDGVILDKKEDNILALIPSGKIEKGAQALTIKDSARLFGLSAASRKGSSLISIAEKKGRFAIFKLVVSGGEEKNAFTPGTKIILEKSNSLKMRPTSANPQGAESSNNDGSQD